MLRTPCVALLLVLAGCTAPAERPAAISHVVLLRLERADDAEALIADCDRLLPGIPGVVAYDAGVPLDTGREKVRSDYHVGLYIGFDSVEDYATYVDHPDHQELLELWGARLSEFVVYDVSRPPR